MTQQQTQKTQPEVQVRDLCRRIGDNTILDNVSLTMQPGEIIAVLGPSGCGKSTLLRQIAGLDQPDGGTIHIGGARMADDRHALPPEKRPVNMVFQDFALWPHMSVARIIQFGMRHRRLPRAQWAEKTRELLALLELDGLGDRYPRQLSGGQQQRVAIARALATAPRLLLLDEPLSNLDARLRLQMRDELAALLRRIGTTAIYVTHDLQEALTLGDRLMIMRDGQVEQAGPSGELFRRPASTWVAGLLGFTNRLEGELEQVDGEHVVVRNGDLRLRGRWGNGGGRPGEQVVLMAQPHALKVANGDSTTPPEELLKARVSHCHYEGVGWRICCEWNERPILLHGDAPLPVGSETAIQVPADHVRVYPLTA